MRKVFIAVSVSLIGFGAANAFELANIPARDILIQGIGVPAVSPSEAVVKADSGRTALKTFSSEGFMIYNSKNDAYWATAKVKNAWALKDVEIQTAVAPNELNPSVYHYVISYDRGGQLFGISSVMLHFDNIDLAYGSLQNAVAQLKEAGARIAYSSVESSLGLFYKWDLIWMSPDGLDGKAQLFPSYLDSIAPSDLTAVITKLKANGFNIIELNTEMDVTINVVGAVEIILERKAGGLAALAARVEALETAGKTVIYGSIWEGTPLYQIYYY